MQGFNKAVNLFAFALLLTPLAQAELKWDDAKAQITKKAETVVNDYGTELCPNTIPMYEAITSEENAEAWDIAKEIIDETAQSTIYKKACEKPTDNVLKSETIIHASMLIGQKVSALAQNDMMKTIAVSMKVGAIVGSYFELLFESLSNDAQA